jgi:hypothetical protein
LFCLVNLRLSDYLGNTAHKWQAKKLSRIWEDAVVD